MKFITRILIIGLLTLVTQIGGLIYIAAIFLNNKLQFRHKAKRTAVFLALYCFGTFLIVPLLAPVFGREKITNTENLQAYSVLYKLANRNYVTPTLNQALGEISSSFSRQHPDIKIYYLDANFPFVDGFPLLPHLSHNDGKKIDLSLIYQNGRGLLSNDKKSRSGYGFYEGPTSAEYDQTGVCKANGNWQYDFPKYLTLGEINPHLKFSEQGTKDLANIAVKNNQIGKLFIEPHLKSRLNLSNNKVRFHGCQTVRHDDHVHIQLK